MMMNRSKRRSGPRGANGTIRVGEAVRRERHSHPHQPSGHGATHASLGARQHALPLDPTRCT